MSNCSQLHLMKTVHTSFLWVSIGQEYIRDLATWSCHKDYQRLSQSLSCDCRPLKPQFTEDRIPRLHSGSWQPLSHAVYKVASIHGGWHFSKGLNPGKEREKKLRWKYGLPIAKQWKQQSAAAAFLDSLEAIQSKERKRVCRAMDMSTGLPETKDQPL